jgi:hypothetical protein
MNWAIYIERIWLLSRALSVLPIASINAGCLIALLSMWHRQDFRY